MKKSNTFLFLGLLLCGLCAPLAFPEDGLPVPDAEELLRRADENTAFAGSDFAATYTIVVDDPRSGRESMTAFVYRRDDSDSCTFLIISPDSAVGTGYVKLGQVFWYYDSERWFENEDGGAAPHLFWSDLSPQSYSRDYRISSATEARLGRFDCVLFELQAEAAGAGYPAIRLWVSAGDGLVRKREDYDLSGRLLRTTAIPSYLKYSAHAVPERLVIMDKRRGGRVDDKMRYGQIRMTVSDVSFSAQGAGVYTKGYLETVAQYRK